MDKLKNLCDDTFTNQLRISSKEQALLYSVSPLLNTKSREQVVKMMFEDFQIQKFLMQDRDVLSVYVVGKSPFTAQVLHIGGDATICSTVIDGYHVPNSTQNVFWYLTEHLSQFGWKFLWKFLEISMEIFRNF